MASVTTILFFPHQPSTTSCRFRVSKADSTIIISNLKSHGFSLQKQNSIFRLQTTRNMNMAVQASIPPDAPFPADPSPGHWKAWVIGAIVTILLSFSKGKWGPFLLFKEKVETTIDEAEKVAEFVEEVAETVDKVAEEAVKHLPKGKLQDAAQLVEDLAQQIDKQAHLAGDALDKVEEIEKDVDSFLESTTPDQEQKENNVDATAQPKDLK